MEREEPLSARATSAANQRTGQQQLQPVRIPRQLADFKSAEVPLTSTPRVPADRFARIVGVSDPRDTGDSLLCHFRPQKHKHGHWYPEQWEQDDELGAYLCTAAAVLQFRDTPTAAPRDWECREEFKDIDGQASLSFREFGGAEERTLPVSGYRGGEVSPATKGSRGVCNPTLSTHPSITVYGPPMGPHPTPFSEV